MKTLRNIVMATLLGTAVVAAPPRNQPSEYIMPDIYGKNMEIKYDKKVPEEGLYHMINYSLYILSNPKYADAKYHRAIIKVESMDNPNARSHMDARGLRQNTKIAWKQVGAPDFEGLAYNPQASISVGIKYTNYIDQFLSKYHPRWNELTDKEKRDLNSAAYNGGPTRLRKNGFDISKMPLETRNYVKKVNKVYESL